MASILRQTGGPAAAAPTPVTPISSAPGAGRSLSEHPEAKRARERRAARRTGQPAAQAPATARESFIRAQPAAGPRLTPEIHQAAIAAIPAPPPVITADLRARAVKNVATMIRGAGWAASAVFRADDMKVPDAEALEVAEQFVAAYPELALDTDGDAAKMWAWAALGSLVLERWRIYQRRRPLPPPPNTATPAKVAAAAYVDSLGPRPELAMEPDSL